MKSEKVETRESPWFETLLSSIETSIARCIEPYRPLDDLLLRDPESLALDGPPTFVLPLSARSREELDNLLWWWADVLENTSVSIARCSAIAAMRRHYACRVAVVATTREGLLTGLRALAEERLVLWCEPGTGGSHVRLAVQHVRGRWVDWRGLHGGERHRLFASAG